MTPEQYWAYQAFNRDDAAEKALSGSEIFMAYKKAEMKREEDMKKIAVFEAVQEKENALKAFEELENKIASNPTLKAKFRQIKHALDLNPELVSKTDPNFVNAISMLNLEE